MTSKQEKKQGEILTVAYREHGIRMNSYAFFKLDNHSDGEDAVQDTFIKTWNYIINGGKIDLMKPFLYHILNNLIIDQYRKRKTTSLDYLLEKGFEPSTDPTPQLFNFLDGQASMLLIELLPLKYQRVMRMRYAQDLSIKEISLITGQSKNAVAVQAHRGLAKLKLLNNRA